VSGDGRPLRDNPPITLLLRGVIQAAAAVLLVAGAGLFFLTDLARAQWPWEVGRFAALFLGAVFLAAAGAVGMAVLYPAWSPARLVLPMLFVHSAVTLLVTLIHLGRFDFSRWTTYAWLALAVLLPAGAGYCLYHYRDALPPAQYPTPPAWRTALLATAVLAGLYGFAMFAAPVTVAGFWPWTVDAFQGRLHSAVFTTLAIGALGLAYFAAPVERLTLGLAFSLLGLFAVFAVILGDAPRRSLDWGAPGVWAWLALFALFFVLGLALIWWSSAPREAQA
jgi:hypothetical protein